MADINQRAQEASPGQLVVLFELDLNPLGTNTIHRFTNTRLANGTDPVWKGNTYTAVDCEAKGFEITGQGPIPQPSILVSNVDGWVGSLLVDYEDLVGATVRRIRTFASFLDGGPDSAESNYAFVTDIYTIEAKQVHNNVFIEWKLSSVLDQQGRKLPGRQVLRDTCTHRYRYWNGSAFDYTNATCPYNGTSYYDRTGAVVAAASDQCGKRLSDCQLRFGTHGELPTRAFPGAARARRF